MDTTELQLASLNEYSQNDRLGDWCYLNDQSVLEECKGIALDEYLKNILEYDSFMSLPHDPTYYDRSFDDKCFNSSTILDLTQWWEYCINNGNILDEFPKSPHSQKQIHPPSPNYNQLINNDIGSWPRNSNEAPSDTQQVINDAVTHQSISQKSPESRAFVREDDNDWKLSKRSKTSKPKSSELELEEIQKYFHLPIVQASSELRVGVTLLKKRCRDLNIARWPHRKIKSLQFLIHNVKELGMTDENEIEELEHEKKVVENAPGITLTVKTKKLRQACFKANYKRRRLIVDHSAFDPHLICPTI